jgi:predicted ATPase
MFISEISLQNFKRFESANIDILAPLTYLLGPNSSGKSSIIKALLGLKQTVSPSNESESFSTQGEYVDLGTYQDFVYGHNIKRNFTIGVCLQQSAEEETPIRIGRQHRFAERISYSFEFDYNPITEQPRVFSISIIVNFDGLFDPLILTIARKATRDTYRLFVNREFVDKNSGDFPGDQRTRFRFWSRGLDVVHLNRLLFRRSYTRGAAVYNDQSIAWMTHFLNLFARELSENLYCIGPIRSSPSRNYIRTSHSRAVGPHGEFTASVLANLSKRAKKVTTGSSVLQDQMKFLRTSLELLFPGKGFTPKTLQELVRLEFFTVATDTTIRPKGESIIDVGFGFSQVFPILVQLAVMPKGSLLVVEQPELHLHPLAQTRLAKVFALAIEEKKWILAETHSDHLIRGTQLAVASAKPAESDEKSDPGVTALYIPEQGIPQKLTISPDGTFREPWPDGFFDVGYNTLMSVLKK